MQILGNFKSIVSNSHNTFSWLGGLSQSSLIEKRSSFITLFVNFTDAINNHFFTCRICSRNINQELT